MSALEIILVFAVVVLALVYVFRIGFKKPADHEGCNGGCGCKSVRKRDSRQ